SPLQPRPLPAPRATSGHRLLVAPPDGASVRGGGVWSGRLIAPQHRSPLWIRLRQLRVARLWHVHAVMGDAPLVHHARVSLPADQPWPWPSCRSAVALGPRRLSHPVRVYGGHHRGRNLPRGHHAADRAPAPGAPRFHRRVHHGTDVVHVGAEPVRERLPGPEPVPRAMEVRLVRRPACPRASPPRRALRPRPAPGVHHPRYGRHLLLSPAA